MFVICLYNNEWMDGWMVEILTTSAQLGHTKNPILKNCNS